MNNRKQVITYVIADYLTAISAWLVFFCFRKWTVDPQCFHATLRPFTPTRICISGLR